MDEIHQSIPCAHTFTLICTKGKISIANPTTQHVLGSWRTQKNLETTHADMGRNHAREENYTWEEILSQIRDAEKFQKSFVYNVTHICTEIHSFIYLCNHLELISIEKRCVINDYLHLPVEKKKVLEKIVIECYF